MYCIHCIVCPHVCGECVFSCIHAHTHTHTVQAVEEAESIIRKVLDELKNPDLGGATCSPAFLLGRTKSCLDVIDSVTESFSVYNSDPGAMGTALSSLSTCAHSMSEVMLLGVATSHLAPAEEGKSE